MKIKKRFQGFLDNIGKILNIRSTSQIDTYSCDYINKIQDGVCNWKLVDLTYNLASCENAATWCYVNEFLRMGMMRIYANTTNIATGTKLVTVPSQYGPPASKAFTVAAIHSNGHTLEGVMLLRPNGEVIINNSHMSMEYPTAVIIWCY